MTIRQQLTVFIVAGSLLSGVAVAVDTGSARAAQRPSRSAPAAADPVATAAVAALAAIDNEYFALRLYDIAYVVATRLGTDARRLRQAWVSADRPHQIALLAALSQVGVAYRRNSSKPGVAFDCSGLTSYAWGRAGVALARQSGTQISDAAVRTRDTAQAGDLAYYPGHVMIWLGVDNFVAQAADYVRDVEVGEISKRRVSRAKFGDPTG
jgi:cell wall-associated NlpC family hydrolase